MTPERRAFLEARIAEPKNRVLAPFLLEIRRRGLRPSQREISRWWRRKRREIRDNVGAIDAAICLVWEDAFLKEFARDSVWSDVRSEFMR